MAGVFDREEARRRLQVIREPARYRVVEREPTDDELIAQALMARALEARHDPIKYFNFVMREERTNEPVVCAPHQKVLLNFALHAKDYRGNKGRAVIILPIEHAKTFSMSELCLFMLQDDLSLRGGIISALESQSQKVLGTVRAYIEHSAEAKLVRPELRPSPLDGAPWTQTKLLVDRPTRGQFGKDYSLQAFGIEGEGYTGSRMDWMLCDDLLTDENVATLDQRDKMSMKFQKTVYGRLTPGGHIMVCNSAKHPDDLLHRLEKMGWPTIRMDAYGYVYITNTDFGCDGELCAEDLVAEEPGSSVTVLASVARETDPERKTLFPERFPRSRLDALNDPSVMLPLVFAQNYLSVCRDDGSAMCKQEYVDTCLEQAIKYGVASFTSAYSGPNMTFTGVDLAVSPNEGSDFVAFVTFEVRPDLRNMRVLLDVDIGKWSGPDIVRKILSKAKAYNSIVTVENNASQDFVLQFAREMDVSVPLKAHTTGRVKGHPEYGVPGFFVEMAGGGWAFPCDKRRRVHKHLQKLIDECLFYAPSHHTGDALMATYFARDTARKFGAGLLPKGGTAKRNEGGSLGMSITSR